MAMQMDRKINRCKPPSPFFFVKKGGHLKDPKDVNILLIGDIMLDKYIIGDVERISPEAPVPIVHVKDTFSTLGGAGNVARNLRSIGANVRCIGMVGWDREGIKVKELLQEIGAQSRLIEELSTTIIKQRVIADQRKVQMLRLDWEDSTILSENLVDEVINMVQENYDPDLYDYIVISDYAKGIVSLGLMGYLHELRTPIIIDPKPQNANLYGRVEMLTPNQKEWSTMQLYDDSFDSEFVLVTEGKDGMTLYDYRQGLAHVKIPGEPVEVYNVSGAGDTVVAVMATCMAMGFYPDKAARIANRCAAHVVTKPGTSIISENKFIDIMQEENIS